MSLVRSTPQCRPALLESGSKTHRSFYKLANTQRNADQKIARWLLHDNHDRFAAVAKGKPQLKPALPISGDIAALAAIGLDVMAALESGRVPGTDWRDQAEELLDRHAADKKASQSIVQIVASLAAIRWRLAAS